MKFSAVQQKIKQWMLPLAMLCGILFHTALEPVQWVVPYLIFTMLFITFCRVKPSDLHFSSLTWKMLAMQLIGAIVIFLILRPLSLPLAQAIFICVLCPTATAAPVVTGMLGGSIVRVATYSIVINLTVAIIGPLLFVYTGQAPAGMGFGEEMLAIALKVGPMILFPLFLALGLYFTARPVHTAIAKAQPVSFYLWACCLFVVMGRAVGIMLSEPADKNPLMVAMCALSLLVCVAQFWSGRRLGRHYGDAVAGAQSLGQKNTMLAIWLALAYLEPISSIGPASYIVWQNIINSTQLYLHMHKKKA